MHDIVSAGPSVDPFSDTHTRDGLVVGVVDKAGVQEDQRGETAADGQRDWRGVLAQDDAIVVAAAQTHGQEPDLLPTAWQLDRPGLLGVSVRHRCFQERTPGIRQRRIQVDRLDMLAGTRIRPDGQQLFNRHQPCRVRVLLLSKTPGVVGRSQNVAQRPQRRVLVQQS